MGKPPALAGDSLSLTAPGVYESFPFREFKDCMRDSHFVIPAAFLGGNDERVASASMDSREMSECRQPLRAAHIFRPPALPEVSDCW